MLGAARTLLQAGADPNAGYLWHGLPTPFTVLTGVRQLRTARPFTIAVQEPHWPSPQPNFGPFKAKSSLRT